MKRKLSASCRFLRLLAWFRCKQADHPNLRIIRRGVILQSPFWLTKCPRAFCQPFLSSSLNHIRRTISSDWFVRSVHTQGLHPREHPYTSTYRLLSSGIASENEYCKRYWSALIVRNCTASGWPSASKVSLCTLSNGAGSSGDNSKRIRSTL